MPDPMTTLTLSKIAEKAFSMFPMLTLFISSKWNSLNFYLTLFPILPPGSRAQQASQNILIYNDSVLMSHSYES